MKLKDARHLSPSAQEALRYRVVNAVEKGMSKSEAARVFKVSRTAVHHWTKAVANKGASSLKAKKRGQERSLEAITSSSSNGSKANGAKMSRLSRITFLLVDS